MDHNLILLGLMGDRRFRHVPVLLNEVVALAEPFFQNGARIIDCTIGGGGHAVALLRACASASLLGLDRDPAAIGATEAALTAAGLRERATLEQQSFSAVQRACSASTGRQFEQADFILADVGVSSPQLDLAQRGFSFLRDGPLDMRMDPSTPLTAASIVNRASETELRDLFRRFGEDPRAHASAAAVVEYRTSPSNRAASATHARAVLQLAGQPEPPDSDLALTRALTVLSVAPAACLRSPIVSTAQLGELFGPPQRRGRHPATQCFQALRIAVNGELDELESLLGSIPAVLAPGGRAAVITFHSLEARLVKNAFRDLQRQRKGSFVVRGQQPSEAEQVANPRSRSARLWGFEAAS